MFSPSRLSGGRAPNSKTKTSLTEKWGKLGSSAYHRPVRKLRPLWVLSCGKDLFFCLTMGSVCCVP